jgi:hypothetical protein
MHSKRGILLRIYKRNLLVLWMDTAWLFLFYKKNRLHRLTSKALIQVITSWLQSEWLWQFETPTWTGSEIVSTWQTHESWRKTIAALRILSDTTAPPFECFSIHTKANCTAEIQSNVRDPKLSSSGLTTKIADDLCNITVKVKASECIMFQP